MTTTTDTIIQVRTKRAAENRAADYTDTISQHAIVGEDFATTYWNGERNVPVLLRFEVVKKEQGYDVVRTMTGVQEFFLYRLTQAGNGVEHAGPYSSLVEVAQALVEAVNTAHAEQPNPLYRKGPFYVVIQEGLTRNHRRPLSYHEQQALNTIAH